MNIFRYVINFFRSKVELMKTINALEIMNKDSISVIKNTETVWSNKIKQLEKKVIKDLMGDIELFEENNLSHEYFGHYYFFSSKKLPSFECDYEEGNQKFKCYMKYKK